MTGEIKDGEVSGLAPCGKRIGMVVGFSTLCLLLYKINTLNTNPELTVGDVLLFLGKAIVPMTVPLFLISHAFFPVPIPTCHRKEESDNTPLLFSGCHKNDGIIEHDIERADVQKDDGIMEHLEITGLF